MDRSPPRAAVAAVVVAAVAVAAAAIGGCAPSRDARVAGAADGGRAGGAGGSGEGAAGPAGAAVAAPGLVWLSVTNWLLDTGRTRLLLDGYLTRIDRRLVEADGSSLGTARTDTAELRRLLAPALPGLRLDRVLVGQGHWDHAFDVPAIARLTGAGIVGARTVCHQATALGSKAACTAVEGGEVLEVGPDVRVRVVRWHHSGDPATEAGLRLSAPLELRGPPPRDPATGGLRPGFLDDYPNGGGSRAYLVTVRTADRPVTLFWSTTGNPAAWETPVPADTAFLRDRGVDLSNLEPAPAPTSAREALEAALRAEGLAGVDYWIGAADVDHVRQVIGTLHPRVFIPHHWDDFWSPMEEGPGRTFRSPELVELLDDAGIRVLVPERYYQRVPLSR